MSQSPIAPNPSGPHRPGDGRARGLILVLGPRRIPVPSHRPFVIGRGPEVDLNLDHPGISRRHLVLEAGPNGWVAVDPGSHNGTYLHGRRINRLDVTGPLTLRLGNEGGGLEMGLQPADLPNVAQPSGPHPQASGPNPQQSGPNRQPSPPNWERTAAQQGNLSVVRDLLQPTISIGRMPDNDVMLDDLLVSRHHAQLRQVGGVWTLFDLGSGNGTFVNGVRVRQQPISERDVIGVGRALLQLDGNRLVTYVDNGDNTFEADGLTVTTAKGKVLLQSVGFALPGRSLLAVIGPSGAGKSTLLNAITATRPATQGQVRYAGRDLYQDFDELRHRIALVPQDDVLHTQLTVRQALGYAARLRFPADTAAADRTRRIEEVLAELGLTEQANQRIDSLSGGQRKRTSVALELLTKPSLLFLDEPTSGLDPGLDRSVMRTLRELADDGRTVVVVTHNVANLELCDNLLLLAPGGHLAYFGPPSEALQYFGQADFADVFLLLSSAPGEEWGRRFAASPGYARLRAAAANRPPVPPHAPSGMSRPARQQSPFTQFGVLCRRYAAVIAADKQYALFLLALPLVLSLLSRAVPGESGLSATAAAMNGDPQTRQLLLVLVMGATLMGTAASIRELVKERAIYRRERAIGLSIPAYFASKLVLLGVVTALQATVFTVLGLLGHNDIDDPLLVDPGTVEILVAVLAVTFASMLTGLLISAAIDNADRGMPLMVVLIMVQLVLCGGLFSVYGRPVLEQIAWLVPARWGYSMAAASAGLRVDPSPTNPNPDQDPAWEHDITIWTVDLGLVLVQSIVLSAAILFFLARLDPRRGKL